MCLTRNRKRVFFRFVFDIFFIGLVAAGCFSIKYGAKPYHRGFFCGDESIKHPVLTDTVTVTTAVLIGLLLPIAVIILIEALLRKVNNKQINIFTQSQIFLQKKSWRMACYDNIVVFIFGMAITQFLTEIGKYSIGRLRPHFLTLCNPDFSKIDCSKGYITDDVCTSTDEDQLRESRLSFPSGHSSFSMYCMLYAIIYVQTRLSCKKVPLLKPTLQIIFFALGFFTCLSRVSDYKHHWSDVLAGAILGMGVCLCVVRSLTDFGKLLFVSNTVRNAQLTEVISSPSTNYTEDTGYDNDLHTLSAPNHSAMNEMSDRIKPEVE